MSFSKLIITILLCLLLPSMAIAAVGVTSSELQSTSEILLPAGENFGSLNGYFSFELLESLDVQGGILATYEAKLLSDNRVDEELPRLQIVAYAYNSQEAAEAAFAGIELTGSRRLLSYDERSFLYESEGGFSVDMFGLIDAEYLSVHKIHVNGNLLYQASIYREDGALNQDNLKAYADAVEDIDQVDTILSDAVESLKISLGILFPPASAELSAKSQKSSLNLEDLYDVPEHGTIAFDLYVAELDGAVGTILDSSGISNPEEGDLYLYVDDEGSLFAGIYAPDFDANCEQQAGWYRVKSQDRLRSYEWNSVDLHYGVNGFSLSVNGGEEVSCRVSQPRSARALYFGDYPFDNIEESMMGFVDNVDMQFSTTDSGLIWDEVLADKLFLDLENNDPDLEIFLDLKERGVFLGSDGMLYPDHFLNRAGMTKILLKSFGHESGEAGFVPFWDVDEADWFHKYVAKAFEIGMIEGNDDGSFSGGEVINRAEFYTMLYRVSGSGKLAFEDQFSDVHEDDWFMPGAAYAYSKKLLNGLFFNGERQLTRRDAARDIYQIINE